ncbi:MAG: helix-turn-helix transcriptional regulator [Alcaligenes sp.]
MSNLLDRSHSNKGEKLAQRLSHILALLHQGGLIDKHALAKEFGVNVRTIERDLNERLVGIAEKGLVGRWRLTYEARSTVPAKHLYRYARFVRTEALFPDASQEYLLKQLERDEQGRTTSVQALPLEDLCFKKDEFSRIQQAIENKQYCCFVYKGKPRDVAPYRLIHRLGIWYLAALEQGILKNFSLALIDSFSVDESRTFVPQADCQAYIDNADDVWFSQDATVVILHVDASIAHYFTRRDLLPRQSHRFEPDGSLRVICHINHINQLLPVVRYWLPNVRIVSPGDWHDVLINNLRETLRIWESGS